MRRLPALVLALAACAHPVTRPDPASDLTGAWRSSVRFRSGPFAAMKDLEFMYAFDAGGTLTESSNYDAAPPVPPAYGVWRRTGTGTFEAHYEFYVTKAPPRADDLPAGGWLPAGRGAFFERITLAPDGKTFTSTLTYEAFDAAGKPAEGGGEAEGKGVRIAF